MYPFNPYFLALTVVGIAALVIGQDLQEIPTDLSFSCDGRAYGYYADPATNCQVFHICLGEQDIKWSFLCPNQTIFNQVKFMTFIIKLVYSEKATKFCEISTSLLSTVLTDKSKVEISQNFVAFSEYIGKLYPHGAQLTYNLHRYVVAIYVLFVANNFAERETYFKRHNPTFLKP